jgi:TRAP-type C4-dicarboxylate transport system substrate-binding protein
VRQAIGEATSEATPAQRRLAATEDDDVLTTLRLAHNEIIHLTHVERAQFIAAVAPVVEEQRQRFGDRLFSYLES